MQDSEHRLQVKCVEYFRLRHPDMMIFAVPNGAKRNVIVARKLKAEGVLAGVPDLFVPVPRGEYGGLFLEMKNGKKGRLTMNQIEVMSKLRVLGYKCEVVRDFESFKLITDEYVK